VREQLRLTPPGPFRLPARLAPDGLTRARGGVLQRLLCCDGVQVRVVSKSRPDHQARSVPASLEDAYLYFIHGKDDPLRS